MEKRVLTSTIDCWNDKVGSNTFSELFCGYGSENIANIYTRAEIPNSDVCNHYFQILENNVLKSIFKKAVKTGRKIQAGDLEKEQNMNHLEVEKKRYNFFKKYRLWIFLYSREFIWKMGNWNSNELNEFVEKFNPDLLFFPIEGSIFFNRINEYLVKKTGKKAIGILWDDNFTYKVKPWWEIGFFIHRFFLKRGVKRLVLKCDTVFSISPKMKEEADKAFKINSILLTKPIDYSNLEYKEPTLKKPLKMVYTGNLLVGRDKTLIKIVEAIKKINENDTKIILDVYTQTNLHPKTIEKINIKNCCNLMGAIPQSEVHDKLENADILVFCEALSGKNKNDARLSFSTKLTDYFSQGKCIFAVGPKDIAPIEYLKENDSALVCSNKKEIESNIRKLLIDKKTLSYYAKKAFDLGYKNHKKIDVHAKVYAIMEEI
jgi:hypothetical protein